MVNVSAPCVRCDIHLKQKVPRSIRGQVNGPEWDWFCVNSYFFTVTS